MLTAEWPPFHPCQALQTSICSLQRNIAMLLTGIRVALVFEGAERGDDAGARVGGVDDRVNVAALGGHERVGKAFAGFGDFFLAEFFAFGFGNSVGLAPVSHIYR